MSGGRARRVAISLAAAAVVAAIVAHAASETVKGTASVTKGESRASAPFSVTVTRYASPQEREALVGAIRTGGTAAARKVLEASSDAGVLHLGEHRTPIKFAMERPTGTGRLITVVTAQPIVHLGAGLPDAKPRTGFDVGVAILDLHEPTGTGELAPAAKVALDPGGALRIDDYGATVVWLEGLKAAR
jgi:hypothetical protein